MIITLTRADFSSCKIGTLTTFNVRKSTVIGASVNIIKTSVERAGYSSATTIATIVLDKANYEGHAIKVMMGSTDVSSWYSSGNVIVPANTPITSNITITVSATAVAPDVPVTPDEPDTPTMYTFTINPRPSNATVTLIASGYTQSGNSISVASGTTVSWTVSADGYYDKNGSETITRDKTLNVFLSQPPSTGGGSSSVVNLFTLKNSIPELLDNGYYRDTTGAIFDEDSQFNVKYPSSEKIYINGNGEDGDFKLNLQSGKVYRWECVPYYEYGYIKLGPPWGLSSSMTGKNFWFYDNNDVLIANDKTTMTDASVGGYCMKIPDGAVYMRFMATAYRDNKSRVLPVLRDRLMVTEGETQYTEYVEPVV